MGKNTVQLWKIELPKLGMRNVKTALCVFVCLFIDYLLSDHISIYSSIVAIVCMQSTIESTLKISINRIVGTAIGGAIGLLLIVVVHYQVLDYLYLIVAPLGIIASIYICNLIKMPGSSVICAIVFITVVIAPIDPYSRGDNVYQMALFRITDTLIGIFVATFINRFIAPPKFYETKKVHLVCNTYDHVYERVKYRLDGSEQLILYDSRLTELSNHKSKPLPEGCEYSVQVPVPTEYKGDRDINTAYISEDFTVTPMYLRQCAGFVEIPCETFPCTVVWQVEIKKKGVLPFSLRD